jgi:hypothetical protein
MSDNNLFFNSEEIRDLPLRTEFVTGPAGPTGSQGAAGAGITIGGITGQVLAKKSNADYDTEWVNQTAFPSVTWGSITGTLSNQIDLQNVLDAKAPSTGISPSAISGTAVITTDARLSDSRSPNGSATGDLSGTYPAPSVAKLQGYSVSATSPSIGQILQWGGDSWLPAAVPNGGSGGGGLVYFLNFQNTTGISPTTGLPTTPFSPSQLGRDYNIGSGSVTSDPLINGSYSFVCGFVTIVGEPNITTIPAGLWDFNIWADVSSASGNHTQFQFRVFKYNSTTGVYTSLANSDDIFLYEPAAIAQYIGNVTMPQTTILATDRIYIEIWAQKNVSGARTVSFYFDSLHPSHIHTTIPSVSGTGVVKVVNSVFQTPANLIFDADVDAAAAIDVSKLSGVVGGTTGTTDNSILRADGTGGKTSQSSGIVIDDATTSTQNNVAITNQHAGQTNSALVLTPKGTGAFIIGPKPDGGAIGGAGRGIISVDLQMQRFSSTQVASGTASFIGGGVGNTASGINSVVAGGNTNTASATQSTVSGGNGNTASGIYSTAGGLQALADRNGMRAYSTGQFVSQGDAQDARFVLRCKTTTNNGVEMALNGATAYLSIPSGKIMAMTINISGVKSDGSAVAHYVRQYAVKNVNGTSTQVYAPVTIGSDNAVGTSIALSVNDSDDTLRILVTGITSETWRWVAIVDAVEIAYGT